MNHLRDSFLPVVSLLLLATCPSARYAQRADVNTFVSSLGLNGSSAVAIGKAVQDLSDNTPAIEKAVAACAVGRIVFAQQNKAIVNEYIDPTAANYTDRIDVNWYVILDSRCDCSLRGCRSDSCWLNASCILSPSTANEVADALRIVTFTGSKFATRSGGHNPNPGFGGVDNTGVLIDMVNINTLQISPDRKTIGIGPGNRWADVYNGLNGSGVFATGGRVPPVGVGGLMLGGGMPFFASLYGLASDAVQDYEVGIDERWIRTSN